MGEVRSFRLDSSDPSNQLFPIASREEDTGREISRVIRLRTSKYK